MSPRIARTLLAVAVLYVSGAVFLALVGPPAALRHVADSEAVHIPAHMLLYGGLSWLLLRLGVKRRTALALTLAVGALQEAAQVVSFGRWPGAPELFDLGVDASAALLASWAHARAFGLQRGASRATERPWTSRPRPSSSPLPISPASSPGSPGSSSSSG